MNVLSWPAVDVGCSQEHGQRSRPRKDSVCFLIIRIHVYYWIFLVLPRETCFERCSPFLTKWMLLTLRSGLAETLRSELLLYSISVHIFFPGAIYSPGYTEENRVKPKITLKIEESDEGMMPEYSAQTLLRGGPTQVSITELYNTFLFRHWRWQFPYSFWYIGQYFPCINEGVNAQQQNLFGCRLCVDWMGGWLSLECERAFTKSV